MEVLQISSRSSRRRSAAGSLIKKPRYLVALLTVAVALGIIAAVLFLPPYIGLEDNGDYSRIMYAQGLYDLPKNADQRFDGYFIKEYGIMQYYNGYSSNVYSSLFVFIQPAIWLDTLVTGNDGIFDIRFLGMMITAYFLVILFLLTDCLTYRLSLPAALLVAGSLIFVFVDTGYTAYFNSFFAENIAYVSLLGCGTAALLFIQKRYNPYLLLGGYLLCGMILTFSKQQFAPVGAILGILGLFIFLGDKNRLFTWLTVLASCALVFTGVLTYLLISQSITNISMYHTMTRGVLMVSEDPSEAVAEFGIDSQYSILDSTIYFDKYPEIDPEDELLQEDFYPYFNVVTVLGYYLKHPADLVNLLKMSAKNAYQIRPSLGNYEKSTGVAPNTLTQTFALYSNLKNSLAPRTLGYFLIWAVVVLSVQFRQSRRLILTAGIILIGVSQIFVSVIGAGDTDLAKHLFLYNVSYDFVNVIFFAYVVQYFNLKIRAKKPAHPAGQIRAAEG